MGGVRRRVRSDEPFELDTFWWSPAPDDGVASAQAPAHAHGSLRYTPERGLELTAFDLLDDAEPFHAPGRFPVLFGETTGHKSCVLFDAVPVSTKGNLAGGHQRIVLRAHQFLLGEHFRYTEDVRSKRFDVRLRGLHEWLRTPFRLNAEQALAGLSREGNPEGLSVQLEGVRLSLGFDWRERGGQVVEEHATASFTFEDEVGLQRFFADWLMPLQDLLVLATREQSILQSLRVERYDERRGESVHPAIRGATRPEAFNRWHVQVVRTPNVPIARPRDSEFGHLLLPAAVIAHDLESTLRRWFELRWELRESGAFFFTRLNQDTPALNTHLLGCMSFAETYHRIRHGHTPVAKDEHARVRALMLEPLGTHPHRQLYEQALNNANRQSNRERMTDLFARARQVDSAIDLREDTLPAELVATRNYLTHWSKRGRNVLSGTDMFDAVRRLIVVLQARSRAPTADRRGVHRPKLRNRRLGTRLELFTIWCA